MNKPVFGLLLGGILGIFDGLTALISAPETAPQIAGIVIGSTFKGLLAGVIIGFFARKVRSVPMGILFGLVVGAFFAFLVALGSGYYLEIILPGSIVGMIVGYATQKYGEGRRPSAAALLLALTLLAPAVSVAWAGEAAQGIDARAAFEALKGLAGEWDGTTEGVPPYKVTYEITAAGTVVMETLFAGSEHEMINMYRVNGDELRVTHYCSAGNQPEMKLDRAASRPGDLVFAFAGGTGFDPAKDSHIHSGRLVLQGDQIQGDWTSWANGKEEGAARFLLKRAGGKAGR